MESCYQLYATRLPAAAFHSNFSLNPPIHKLLPRRTHKHIHAQTCTRKRTTSWTCSHAHRNTNGNILYTHRTDVFPAYFIPSLVLFSLPQFFSPHFNSFKSTQRCRMLTQKRPQTSTLWSNYLPCIDPWIQSALTVSVTPPDLQLFELLKY